MAPSLRCRTVAIEAPRGWPAILRLPAGRRSSICWCRRSVSPVARRCDAATRCARLLADAPFIDRPLCSACGLPLDFDSAARPLCGSCARVGHAICGRPRRSRLRRRQPAADPRLQELRPHRCRARVRPLDDAGRRRRLDDADGLVPVPLHWTRLFARRYNQAALLAPAVGRLTGMAVAPDALIRRPGGRKRCERWARGARPQRRRRLRRRGRRARAASPAARSSSSTT